MNVLGRVHEGSVSERGEGRLGRIPSLRGIWAGEHLNRGARTTKRAQNPANRDAVRLDANVTSFFRFLRYMYGIDCSAFHRASDLRFFFF